MNPVPWVPRAVTFSNDVAVRLPVESVFEFVRTQMPQVYRETALGHERFDVRGGGPLVVGALIDCVEEAGNQRATHLYRVHTVEPSERIAYRSEPTRVEVRLGRRVIHAESVSHVVYDFAAQPDGSTRFRLAISVQMAHRFQVLMNRLLGGFAPWRKHCAEEVAGLARVLEQANL